MLHRTLLSTFFTGAATYRRGKERGLTSTYIYIGVQIKKKKKKLRWCFKCFVDYILCDPRMVYLDSKFTGIYVLIFPRFYVNLAYS